jgi:Effector-associated domain 11
MSKQRQQVPKSRLILELSPELAVQLYAAFHQSTLNPEETRRQIRQFLQNPSAEDNFLLPTETSLDLTRIKSEFKELVIEDVGQALKIIKEKLTHHTAAYDALIILYSRFNRINRSVQQNTIEFSVADIELSKLENALIYLINNLTQEDLKVI